MAILQVRDIPEELYENLTLTAKREHRSISQETIYLLKNALQGTPKGIDRRNAILHMIDQLPQLNNPDELPSPEDLIGEDRKR